MARPRSRASGSAGIEGGRTLSRVDVTAKGRGRDIFFLKFVAAICPKGSTLVYNSQLEKLQISTLLSLIPPRASRLSCSELLEADINVQVFRAYAQREKER